LSKFLSDEWLKEKQLFGAERTTIGLLNESKMQAGKPRLVTVTPATLVSEALQLMTKQGLSQLPVIEEGKSVGSLRENRIMAQLLDNRDWMEKPVGEVMDAPFPVVNEEVEVERAVMYLKDSPAILIEEYGRIVGILTRYDVIDIERGARADGQLWSMIGA
jgi:cystathionine beta-synthase